MTVAQHITVPELADALKVSPATVYRWVRLAEVPFVKVGSGVRFDPAAIDLWLTERSSPAVRRSA